MITEQFLSVLVAIIVAILIFILSINLVFPYDTEADCCSVCGSYYAEEQLLKGKDPGDCCGGLYSALDQVWYECNFGRHNGNLKWLESIRTKYNFSGIHNFLSINYNNPCPASPSLKYLGTGYIVDYIPWSYDGPAYSVTKIQYNNTNHTFNNCGWNPFPYNYSNLTHVFREKGGAWWNQFKEAELYDVTIHPSKPEQVNASWVQYQIDYDKYLINGGIDIGDGYG